jgi:hypothetical protein
MSWGTTDTWTGKQINTVLDSMVDTALDNYNSFGKETQGENWKELALKDINETNWADIVKGTPLENFGYDFAKQWLGTDKKDAGYLNWEDDTEIDAGGREVIRAWLKETGDAYTNRDYYDEQYNEGLRDVEEKELSLMSGQEIVNTQDGKVFATDSLIENDSITFKDQDGK